MKATVSAPVLLPPVRASRFAWLGTAGLLLLCAIPLLIGTLRLTQLAGGAAPTPENARFFASPLPVVLHIVSVSVFAVLGAFQFRDGLRRRWPLWHRAAGRIVVMSGLIAGVSGLWMAGFYPHAAGTGDLLQGLRLLFGTAMIVSLLLAFRAILRRDIPQHRAWMMRGYAIGVAAGTQTLTGLLGALVLGKPSVLAGDLLMGLAWVINLGVAEWVIRRGQGQAGPGRATIQAGD